MTVRVSTPRLELVHRDVVHLRFATDDGWRGVLPGHEPSRATLVAGALALACADAQTRWIASEGGLIAIERGEVRVLTRWAVEAESLDSLTTLVALRDRVRAELESEARARARRHELAARRALIALERKVVRR
jgi:F0F1-type ATP synthase epsilon subunit